MKRNVCVLSGILLAVMFSGCSRGLSSVEDDANVPSVAEVYAEAIEYPKLAEFLTGYYQIPEKYQDETRYYYNYVDLNDDGAEEIFVVVIGEYTEVSFGDPAVILRKEGEIFSVIDAFEGIHTPVTISDNLTNGWHDIIYQEYGLGTEYGFRICRYNPDKRSYQTELSEILEEMEPVGGTQILSNNLIDDMDQGKYLTLAPEN